MKITKEQLRSIIKEEKARLLSERYVPGAMRAEQIVGSEDFDDDLYG